MYNYNAEVIKVKLTKYIKKHPFDSVIWGFIIIGLMIAGYFVYTVFLTDEMGVKYGTRLEGIEAVPVQTNVIDRKMSKDSGIAKVAVNIKGKIVNIEVVTEAELTKSIINKIATLTIDSVESDVKAYYDMQLFIVDKGYPQNKMSPVIGYMKAGSTAFAWTYNKGVYSE